MGIIPLEESNLEYARLRTARCIIVSTFWVFGYLFEGAF
jgi:hypothetical protein